MYDQIFVAIDNSRPAAAAARTAVELAKELRSTVRGVHVTNAALHTSAFQMLEDTLPEKYQSEEILEEQRDIHDDLIGRGLHLISDSYLADLREQAREKGVECTTEVLEGRHFEVLARAIDDGRYPLAVFGDVGQGTNGNGPPPGFLGSVVDRVGRRIVSDLLVVKQGGDSAAEGLRGGTIVVAVDGSDQSFRALRKALVLTKLFDATLHAVHVFDPEFHRTVFKEMAGVLSEEASDAFDFEGQQELHDTVIDGGLEKVGHRHLHTCEIAAEHAGVEITTELLAGRFHDEIVAEAERIGANLIVAGRFGRHKVDSLDMGSTASLVCRYGRCSILLVNSDVPADSVHFLPHAVPEKAESLLWSGEASALLSRAPEFVRKMARGSIEDWARKRGRSEVDLDTVRQAMKDMLPAKMLEKMMPGETGDE